MVNSYSISLKGTLSRWMSYSELGVFCDTVNKKIPCNYFEAVQALKLKNSL